MKFCEKTRGRLFRLLSPIFDLNLAIKMGVVIFACVLVNSAISLYLFHRLGEAYENATSKSFEQCEYVAQTALRHLAAITSAAISEETTKKTVQALKRLFEAADGGGRYLDLIDGLPVGYRNLDQVPAAPPEVKRLISEARQAAEALIKLTETSKGQRSPEEVVHLAKRIEGTMAALLAWANQGRKAHEDSLVHGLTHITHHFWWIIAILGLFLIWGALAFFFMVVRPIRAVTEKIRLLSSGKGTVYEEEQDCLESYYANDEIGRLIRSVNEMIIYYRNLATFKHLIEEDETVEEVYDRLAQVFKEQIELPSFVIYQVSDTEGTMAIVSKHPETIEINQEKLMDVSRCRARRTGHTVSSLGLPGACNLFLWGDEAQHYCIPMMSAGTCLGVVQFILPYGSSTRRMKGIRKKLELAERYINEAIPVIEAKRYAGSLKEQSFRDPLTTLFNRRFLDSILDNLVSGIDRRNSVLGVLMADIDYFKSVNDKYGHDIGDLVLKEVAAVLKDGVRKADLAVRFGGEEFLILLADITEGEAERVAEKLRAAVEEHPINTPRGTINKTISIGVSEYPVDAPGIWEAIKYADVALYRAKEEGRNRVVRFKPEMWHEKEY